MHLRHSIIAVGALTLLSAPLSAQSAPVPSSAIAAMQRVAFLVGDWEGDGWIVVGRGERRTFHQHENVRAAAGGAVIVIDGLGTSTDKGREGEVIHQAFAVISYDSAAAKIRWRAYRGSEELVDTPSVSGDTLVWGMDVGPRGATNHITFTIRRTAAGEWKETGEMNIPNAPKPYQFFEMTLTRR